MEIEILKELFTPEEAYIATKLSFFPQNLKKINRKLKESEISLEELEKTLYAMYEKGTIMIGEINNEKVYLNVQFVVGMYEYQLGRLTPSLVNNIFRYFDEAFFEKEFNLTGIPQLRTVPINAAIANDSTVASYDQLRTIISNSDPIGIMDCICRKAHDLIGDPCKKTDLRETCMTFGSGAKLFQERGLARFITKEEALKLAIQFEEEGLVASPSNSQKPFVVCNCCGDCCEIMVNQKKFKSPARFFSTNYYAVVDGDLCVGCGICEERCQMEAITIDDGKITIDLGRCIGCGVCVPTCSEEALSLRKKEHEWIPPERTKDTYVAIMDKKAEIARKSA